MTDKDREDAISRLKACINNNEDCGDALWEAVKAFQGEIFYTTGRKNTPPLPYSYTLKVGRNGALTEELLISRKENSKTLTRSTVELGFRNALECQAAEGYVKGPKRLKVFGASYLYPIFLLWGIISRRA